MQLFFRRSACIILALFVTTETHSQTFPKYGATIGGNNSGRIKREQFLAQTGVGGVWFVTKEHWKKVKINRFTILVLRDTATVLHSKNYGRLFNDQLTKDLKTLVLVNDRIIVYNIYGRDYNDKAIFIPPLEYVIE